MLIHTSLGGLSYNWWPQANFPVTGSPKGVRSGVNGVRFNHSSILITKTGDPLNINNKKWRASSTPSVTASASTYYIRAPRSLNEVKGGDLSRFKTCFTCEIRINELSPAECFVFWGHCSKMDVHENVLNSQSICLCTVMIPNEG
jgi:hypothetical protein